MSTIVDPTNENVALVDGEIAMAIRFIANIADPTKPTVAEINAGKIVGYGDFGEPS